MYFLCFGTKVNKMEAMAWKSQAQIGHAICCSVKQFWRLSDKIEPDQSPLFASFLVNWFIIFFPSSSLHPTGYFTQISTLADVQENVMEYLHVLSRPKVIDQEHDTVWTEAYIDSTVSSLHHLLHGHGLWWTILTVPTMHTHWIVHSMSPKYSVMDL